MTFMWIDNGGLPRRQYGQRRFERRIDDRTASDIADAMRARGTLAAAQAMEYLRVDADVALRVLARTSKRRGEAHAAAAQARSRRAADASCAASDDFDPALAGA